MIGAPHRPGSSATVHGRPIGVIGSHGAVGARVVDLLREAGCEVACANRTRNGPDDNGSVLDVRDAPRVREFAQGLDVLVNCAGPSSLIGTSVAAALPTGTVYIDPFGSNAFDGCTGEQSCIINVGCTPGLSGMLTRHLAGRLDDCEAVTVCCGGREQGGVAGFADVVLSTRAGYGHPNQMIVDGELTAQETNPWEAEDTDAFPDGAAGMRSSFVTDELVRVARACRIRRLDGLLVIPDRDSLHLLLKAM
ncbi:MAG: NAD-dependent epimerase/dehydratase family protein, partial [Brachybacterium sp.]